MKKSIVNFLNNLSTSIVVNRDVVIADPISIFKNEANLYNLAVAFENAIISDAEFIDDMVQYCQKNKEEFKVNDEEILEAKNWATNAKVIPQKEYRIRYILRRLRDEIKNTEGNLRGLPVEHHYEGHHFDDLFNHYMKYDEKYLAKDTGDNSKRMPIGSVVRIGNCAIDKLVDSKRLHPADAFSLRKKFDAWCVEEAKPAYAVMHAAREMARELV